MQPFYKDANFRLLICVVAGVVLIGSLPWILAGAIGFLVRFWPGLIVAAHMLFANGIARDAGQRRRRGELLFLDTVTWTVGVLVFGLVAVALYWTAHYSRLRAD